MTSEGRRRRAWIFAALALSGVLAACSLNPQPLPPDTDDDAGARTPVGVPADASLAATDAVGGGATDAPHNGLDAALPSSALDGSRDGADGASLDGADGEGGKESDASPDAPDGTDAKDAG